MKPLGDSALIIEVGEQVDEATHARVQATWRWLEQQALPGVTEIVPAYTTVTLFYDPIRLGAAGAAPEDLAGWLGQRTAQALAAMPSVGAAKRGRLVEIPICYELEFAPDLAAVAQARGLAMDDVIRLHQATDFLVYMLGFAPGFPYLGGLPEKLSVPRRASPRPKVAAGSVGIIGTQCCIYPIETPGGWNLIGRTPLRLFRPELEPPVLLQPGDRVRFRAITRERFDEEVRA